MIKEKSNKNPKFY